MARGGLLESDRAPSLERLTAALARFRPTPGFLCAWLVLNAIENVAYPHGRPYGFFALPCIDLVFLFAFYVWLGRTGRRTPAALHVLFVVVLVLVRFLRVGDGFAVRFLRRLFHFHLDSVLLPELARLLHLTASPLFQALAVSGLLAVFSLTAYAAHRALRHAERSLARPANARFFGAVTAVFGVLSLTTIGAASEPWFWGAFSASGVVRVGTEAVLLSRVPAFRADVGRRIAATGAALDGGPNDLKKLGGADVFLFLVESYGETVVSTPVKAERVRPVFASFERELGARGFSIASSVLNSPTFGGGSWLAHATLATGVKIEDQLSYDLLTVARPPTLSDYFDAAGYRTVLVQPATTRSPGPRDYLRFDRKYFAADFEYRGPEIGWGRFPDQFVLDFVRRKEEAETAGPRFVAYMLVTSHTPWAAVAPVLDDWSAIGDGSVFERLPVTRHSTRWTRLEEAAVPYMATIVYDLEVLRRYVAEFVSGDSLVVILGDHQPVADVAGGRSNWGVPVHVMSRRREFIDAFRARGYTQGMWPRAQAPYAGLETFVRSFLLDFSVSKTETRR